MYDATHLLFPPGSNTITAKYPSENRLDHGDDAEAPITPVSSLLQQQQHRTRNRRVEGD